MYLQIFTGFNPSTLCTWYTHCMVYTDPVPYSPGTHKWYTHLVHTTGIHTHLVYSDLVHIWYTIHLVNTTTYTPLVNLQLVHTPRVLKPSTHTWYTQLYTQLVNQCPGTHTRPTPSADWLSPYKAWQRKHIKEGLM